MKTTDFIIYTIDRFPKGYVFTYLDFITEVNKKDAIIKALNRMTALGKIGKLSKGKFYKLKDTQFGKLGPIQSQVVKDLLEEDGKITGYMTSFSIFNNMGLTTQVSNTIVIAKNKIRPNFKRERYSICFVKQNNTITKENIKYLQILDVLRFIKKIPDASIENSCKIILTIIDKIPNKEIDTIIRLALKYPPSTRALLGSILDQLQKNISTEPLVKSLNPISKYKLSGVSKALTTTNKWNII
jgi:hypothetical protein